MRQAALLFGVFVLFTASASAQVESVSPALSASLTPDATLTIPGPMAASSAGAYIAAIPALSSKVPEAADPAAAQQVNVYGVFPQYHWQAYAGYTFVRVYIAPHYVRNTNGLNLSLQYFPWTGHFAGDGEFIGSFGSHNAKFAAGLGGLRGRWSIPLGLELWGHGMVGGAHFLPQTSFGSQSALAYEVGGGVDFGHTNGRFAYRVSADMVGTHFFGTFQYSPKLAFGVLYKF
jgi:hypothetical protein